MAYAFPRDNKGAPSFTGMYQGPDGSARSAGTFASRRAALRAAHREEQAVREGRWRDRALGETTFAAYVENGWLPSKHLELTTRAAYRSNLDRHFLPFFGNRPMARILPSLVQEWVTKATADGLSPRSVRKYHVVLHSIFERAVRDQLILTNPCAHTELPKIRLIGRRGRTLTPDEFTRLLAAIPERHRLLVTTSIETGMRWGNSSPFGRGMSTSFAEPSVLRRRSLRSRKSTPGPASG
jgi:integrase